MRSAPSTQRSPSPPETEASVRALARYLRARRHAEALAAHLRLMHQRPPPTRRVIAGRSRMTPATSGAAVLGHPGRAALCTQMRMSMHPFLGVGNLALCGPIISLHSITALGSGWRRLAVAPGPRRPE
jgi:hypothetical protein